MANVFEHLDYRAFLGQWYREAKAENPRLTYRAIATQVGFRSTGFFTQILKDQTNISLGIANGFAEMLELKGRAKEYFLALVAWNQAKDEATLLHSKQRLEQFREFHMLVLGRDQSEFMSQWHHAVIRELLAIRPTRDGWERLGNLLQPAVPAETAKQSVDLLLSLGLAVRTASGIERKDKALSTGIQATTEQSRSYYLQMLELAREAVERFPRDERNLSWVTLSVSEKSQLEIVEEIRSFRKRMLEIAAKDPKPTRVHQLNIQFFPVSHPILEPSR